jgi:hypothetical protein
MTIWAAIVAGAAVLFLVAIDHRKPARRRAVAQTRAVPVVGRRPPMVQVVEQLPVRRHKRTPWWRRLLALFGTGAIGVVTGAVLAVILAGLVAGAFLALDAIVK